MTIWFLCNSPTDLAGKVVPQYISTNGHTRPPVQVGDPLHWAVSGKFIEGKDMYLLDSDSDYYNYMGYREDSM